MELYAKSKAKQLSIKEVEALKETLESFLDSLEGILTPKEEQIIKERKKTKYEGICGRKRIYGISGRKVCFICR